MEPSTHWHGEPVGVRAAVWGVPTFEAWTSLSSTNDRARELAAAGAPAWSVVVADRQTAGRGRAGRAWQSDAGAGLWTSLVLRPRSPIQGGLLPLLTGVAVARAVEADPAAAGVRVGLKWPNDLWIDGRKVAGILCEAAGRAVVVGLGVNLRPPAGGFDAAHAGRAGSLEEASGRAWSAPRLLGGVIRQLRALHDPPHLRFEGPVARAWAERDILRGGEVRIGAVRGRAAGVDPDGALRVEQADGTVASVRAGHVEWSPPVPRGVSTRGAGSHTDTERE